MTRNSCHNDAGSAPTASALLGASGFSGLRMRPMNGVAVACAMNFANPEAFAAAKTQDSGWKFTFRQRDRLKTDLEKTYRQVARTAEITPMTARSDLVGQLPHLHRHGVRRFTRSLRSWPDTEDGS